MKAYLGIDIAKAKFDVTLLVNEKTLHKVCKNTPEGFAELLAWLEKRKVSEVHACMEATGKYWENLAIYLCEAAIKTSVVNPAGLKAFAQSKLTLNKTDKADSQLIAYYCKAHEPEGWVAPPKEVRDLQALVRRLAALQDMRQQEVNRLESGESELQVRASIISTIAHLDAEIRRLTQQIKDHVNRHPNLKKQRDLLISIPGIAEVTAVKILGEIGNILAFRGVRQLVAYAGLNPQQHQSGSSVHGRSHLSKIGNSRLRTALYRPAVVAKKYNPHLQAFSQRLKERGLRPKAIIGAVMRKLLHIVYGVLVNQQPFKRQPFFA